MSCGMASLLMKVTLPPTATTISLGLTPLLEIVTTRGVDGEGAGAGAGAGVGVGEGAAGAGADPHAAAINDDATNPESAFRVR